MGPRRGAAARLRARYTRGVHWFAFMAVGATVGFVKKLIARHRHGNEVAQILEDPPEVRTLARFELAEPARAREVLATVGRALAPEVDGWVATADAIRARPPGQAHEVDVVRLARREGALFTLELTRAWTGPDLDTPVRGLLLRIHAALHAHPAVRELVWHWRQDRGLVVGHPVPVAAAIASG